LPRPVEAVEFDAWAGVFARLGIPPEVRSQIAARCRSNGTPVQAEILASGRADEDALDRSIADELGIRFSESVGPDDVLNGADDCLALFRRGHAVPAIRLRGKGASSEVAVVADRLRLSRAKALVAGNPEMRRELRMVSRRRLRAALLDKCRPQLMRNATGNLFGERPELSARTTITGWQGYSVGVASVLVPLLFVAHTQLAWMALHLASSFFFLACVCLRGAALTTAAPGRPAPLSRFSAAELPTYSVLVALYKEAEIVPELLVALGSILWPRGKLEIKLVCEADDRETLAALRSQPLKPWVEIIEVPAGGPRTKPKALAYALPVTSGDFVVLYDAEDRPHPAQLIEAWQTFRAGPPELACLQAPLEIRNGGGSLMTRMFGLEYSALFNGLLPFLSGSRLLIPLGGTSNHFRRSALEEVGAWDPFNVTEDADLGLRLLRFGYRTRTITRPTYEAAPDRWGIWVRQRTRWFKGWCQTWLVHMRSPARLWAEIGPGSFLVAQVLFAGLVLSAIAHPLMIATGIWVAWNLVSGVPLGVLHSLILIVDTTNIVCGYATFLLLGWRTLEARDRRKFWKMVLFTPGYWLMMSFAAWRAVWHLWTSPHRWEKTPHFRAQDDGEKGRE
jgi:cellulose synthase/poly-beta-1,6-N-acetylglucosamine synthase-like glycosyltransferase